MPVVSNEPRSKGGFDLGDYVEVKDRIKLFYEKHPDGRLVTERVEIWQDDGIPRIVVKALAYRTPDDPHPGPGWSWMALPGTTSYTRGSELENTETSAWGRAIGSLGIGLEKGVATKDEVKSHADQGEDKPVEHTDDGSLIGTVAKGSQQPADMELRYEPDGTAYTGFVLTQGRSRLQVVAVSPLADVLQPLLVGVLGQRVSVWGTVEMVPWRKGDKDMPPFRRLQLARIQTEEWTLPAPQRVPPPFEVTPEEAAAIIAREKAEAEAESVALGL